jgi:bifunctional polynucleotide phosphatase/kinase
MIIPQYAHITFASVQEFQASGYKLVIFTNQALIGSKLSGKAATTFKAKVDSILAAARVEASVCVATLKDYYRKPGTGMWNVFVDQCNGGMEVDKEISFYVGDASGRSSDHSADDLNFAQNIGLPFLLPEDVFR